MGNQRRHRQNHQRRPSKILSSVFVAAIIVVLLGAVSAIFGLGSAAFTGKFGSLQITTTSVGLVLVIGGLIFLYRMARLIPPDDFVLYKKKFGDPYKKRTPVDLSSTRDVRNTQRDKSTD